MMDPKKLAQEIIDGRRLTREDDLKTFSTLQGRESYHHDRALTSSGWSFNQN